MRKCYPGCQHRLMVEEYRAARHSQMLEEEAITYGDPWMIEERREQGRRPLVFKEWLRGRKR